MNRILLFILTFSLIVSNIFASDFSKQNSDIFLLKNLKIYYSSDYKSIEESIAALTGKNATLVINQPLDIKTDLSILRNISIEITNGAMINIPSGIKLTIDTSLVAQPNSQIFTGEGEVVFGLNSPLKDIIDPQWWGAKPYKDSTLAFQKAINSCPQTGRILIPSGTYIITSTLAIPDSKMRITLEGLNHNASILNFDPVFDNESLFEVKAKYVTFKGFACSFKHSNNKIGGTCFSMDIKSKEITFENLDIINFPEYGLKLNSGMYYKIFNVMFVSNGADTGTVPSGSAIICNENCNNFVISSCRFSSNKSSIIINSGSNVVVEKCSFEGNGLHNNTIHNPPIQFKKTSGLVFTGNYLEGEITEKGMGVVMFDTCIAPLISGNIFAGQRVSDIIIQDNASENLTIQNNCFSNPANFFFSNKKSKNMKTPNNIYLINHMEVSTYDAIMDRMDCENIELGISKEFIWEYPPIPSHGNLSMIASMKNAKPGDQVVWGTMNELDDDILVNVSIQDKDKVKISLRNLSLSEKKPGTIKMQLRLLKYQ